MKRRLQLFAATATAAALLLSSGCTGSGQPTAGGTQGPLEKVTYVTGAGVLGREAFVYVAMDKGFFRDAGLDVDVVSGTGTVPNLQLLQGGQAQYVAVDITGALIEWGKNTFRNFTIVSAIQQKNLACFMAVDGKGISSPRDLAGKKIGYIPGGVTKLLWDAYADLAGVDPASVTWVNVPIPQMGQALGSGNIDVATQFVVGQPAIEAAMGGKKLVVMPFSDYLTDLYGVGLAVSKDAAQNNPDQVRRFNTAMLKGLAYANAHPDEAAQIYAKYQQAQKPEVAAKEISIQAAYADPGEGAPLGAIDQLRATRNIAILQSTAVIPASFDASDVIDFDLVPKS